MPAMALPTSDYVDPSRTHTIAYSAPTGDYVPTENTRTMPAPTPTTAVVTTSGASVIVVSASTSAILITSGGQTVISHTTISAHSSTTQVALTQTIVSTPTSNPPEPSSSSDAFVLQNSGKVGVISYKWDPGNVFLATYLTVVIAVLYRMLITILNNNFTLIEPFRQLMEPNGVPAERAFFSFYQNQSNLYGPIPALSKQRWALALVSTAYLIASTLPALASEAIWVDTSWNCLSPIQGSKNPCQPRMTVSVTVVRIMQGLLAFIALVIVFITILLLVKRTGLPANPSSIATIGSLMRHPGLVDDINDLPVGPGARVSEMKAAMAGKRYKLERYKTETGALHYGIRPLTIDLQDEYSTGSKGRGSYTPIDNNSSSCSHSTTKSHRFRWMDLVLLMILGTFGVVLAYYLDGKPDGFNNCFSSNTFGPRFILTLAGTLIATSWHSIEQTAVVMTPYIALATKASPARRTLCFTPSNTPLLSTWTTLRSRCHLPALITFTTIMAEALNIVISGVPFATGQTWGQFLVSAYMSLAILGIMIVVALTVMLRRRKEPKIPVRPDTLAGKMYYLSGSRLLDDFEGLDGVGQSVRDKRLCGLGKRYAFQPMMRRDGRRTWLVDEVGDGRGFT